MSSRTNAPLTPPLTADERRIEQRLRDHVERLAGLIGPRHVGRPTSLEAAASYIEQQFAHGTGETVERQCYTAAGRRVANLVIDRPGTRGPHRIVLVGAHYDTVPETPGSAVAAMIEVARLLHGRALRRTVRFIAFVNEEPPHFYTQTMGSQVYARQCKQRREQIVGLICLEMVGYFDTRPGSQHYPRPIAWPARWLMPRAGGFIGAVSNLVSARLLWRFRRGFKRAVKFPLVAVPLPQAIREIRLSDHGPFWDEGFAALMVTDTSFFRNPHYHRATDTPDTLDYERLTRVVAGVAGGVVSVAGGED